jgi:glyoxylase-like metal-dependent hydrolase (beta-lactamase superfamily II)
MESVETDQSLNLAYLVWSGSGEGLVIDPSFAARALWEKVEDKGVKVAYIVNTHGHFDHSKGNPWLAERTGARVAIHEADAPMLVEPADMILHGGETLGLGDLNVDVMHTPGHTPGGSCLLAGGDSLFTGDTLFVGNCGRTDLQGGSDQDLFDSLQRLKGLGEDVKVFPGHSYGGTSSTIGRERNTNPAMRCTSVDEFRLIP